MGALMDRERACDGECFVASGEIALVRFCCKRMRVSQLPTKREEKNTDFLGYAFACAAAT
jgi:hypothetical protein